MWALIKFPRDFSYFLEIFSQGKKILLLIWEFIVPDDSSPSRKPHPARRERCKDNLIQKCHLFCLKIGKKRGRKKINRWISAFAAVNGIKRVYRFNGVAELVPFKYAGKAWGVTPNCILASVNSNRDISRSISVFAPSPPFHSPPPQLPPRHRDHYLRNYKTRMVERKR